MKSGVAMKFHILFGFAALVGLQGCALTDSVRGVYTDRIPIAEDMKANYVIDASLLQAVMKGQSTYGPYGAIDATLRNRLQDSMIAKSNYLCELYKDRLRLGRAQVNFSLAGLATGAAAASAIVTGPLAGDILAGTAAVLTGVRSEYNDVYFEQLSIQIVTKGIDSRRKTILREIEKSRENNPGVNIYTAQRAVADAMQYHVSCSVTVALEEASDKIDEAQNRSITGVIEDLNKLRELKSETEALTQTLNETLAEGE